jgi:L-lysine exporter family protein LysE/ArgO
MEILMHAFLSGFGVSLGLIVAIGAQNAFVLRQGIRREPVLSVVLFCVVSDCILIWAGIFGLGAVTAAVPSAINVMRWGGAFFLIVYGAISFRSAWRGGAALDLGTSMTTSLGKTMAVLFALTWLNPHVYLDTIGLIGSIAQGYGDAIFVFGLGATMASTVFFFSLGFGARYLAPVFQRPGAWCVLDVCIGAVMWLIAMSLLID